MRDVRLFYDAVALLYAVSLVLYFIDALHPRRVVNRVALMFLFSVFLLTTGFLLTRLVSLGYVPMYSRTDATLLLSWLIVLVALCVDAFFRIDLLLFFANALGFSLVAYDTFARFGVQSPTRHQSDLLFLHVSLAITSYVAFSFAFLFTVMYTIQDRLLRQKRWTRWFFRLPALDRLDQFSYRFALVGFPLLLVAMILGAIYEWLTTSGFRPWDPKSVATYVVWMMYGGYLMVRSRTGWGGPRLRWYSLACFAAVLINFWVVGSFSHVHMGL